MFKFFKTPAGRFLVISAGLAGLAALVILYFFPYFRPMGTGSKAYAQKWAAQFKLLNSIEAAQNKYADIASIQIDDGRWIYGIGLDSHFSPGGGTIVLRDSNGGIRCFFGHVCGRGCLQAQMTSFKAQCRMEKRLISNPEEFYNFIVNYGFTEWKLEAGK